MKTTPEKIAEFLGANKMRGEKLHIAVQVARSMPQGTQAELSKALVRDITESYHEIFGELPTWEDGE